MAKGRFNIKGTKDFLVMAVFCAFLCLWSVRDAWFPSKKVLEKHPQTVEVAMEVSGVMKSLPLHPGEEFAGAVVLATIYDDSYREALALAEAEFTEAKEMRVGVEVALEKVLAAREALKACSLRNTDIIMETSHGEDALQGKVLEHLVKRATHVDAGDPVLLVQPKDTFYAFNKSLALFSFMGLVVALVFHRIASH